MERRSPSGERGLKYAAKYHRQAPNPRRSPSGERGLKYIGTDPIFRPNHGCSPSGERGLKYPPPAQGPAGRIVAPHPGSVD